MAILVDGTGNGAYQTHHSMHTSVPSDIELNRLPQQQLSVLSMCRLMTGANYSLSLAEFLAYFLVVLSREPNASGSFAWLVSPTQGWSYLTAARDGTARALQLGARLVTYMNLSIPCPCTPQKFPNPTCELTAALLKYPSTWQADSGSQPAA